MLKFISINIIAAISLPPPLISQLFSPRLFKAAPFFHSLAVFVWIVLTKLKTTEGQVASILRMLNSLGLKSISYMQVHKEMNISLIYPTSLLILVSSLDQ